MHSVLYVQDQLVGHALLTSMLFKKKKNRCQKYSWKWLFRFCDHVLLAQHQMTLRWRRRSQIDLFSSHVRHQPLCRNEDSGAGEQPQCDF